MMICIQDTGHSLVWYLHSSSISNTTIDDMEEFVFLPVEHQITFHFFTKFTRQCSGGHDSMPRLVPCSALPTRVADTLNQDESDAVQTYLAQDEYHLRLFRMEPAQV
eukprot:5706186-Pyramimonas_sp.AAC.1